MLIYKNEALLNNMLNVFDDKMSQYAPGLANELQICDDLNYIIHDFDYISRKECLKYCIQNTMLIPKMI